MIKITIIKTNMFQLDNLSLCPHVLFMYLVDKI